MAKGRIMVDCADEKSIKAASKELWARTAREVLVTVFRYAPDSRGRTRIKAEFQCDGTDNLGDYTDALRAVVLGIAHEFHLTPLEVWEHVGEIPHPMWGTDD